tara:strand:+ start:420 stop:536 length:117 start_codon:yes stop_codon:yes gene_type:complete
MTEPAIIDIEAQRQFQTMNLNRNWFGSRTSEPNCLNFL